MPINFDPNSLNNVFDKNFGAGSYNTGLRNARNAAMLKVKANFAQQDMTKRINAARTKALKDQEYLAKYGMTYDAYQAQKTKNKSFQGALDYWSDPTRTQNLKQKGAYQTANDLISDPQAQEDLKNQGYDISKVVDAAYNVASNGQFKSKKAYDQYATQLDKSNTDKKANQDSIDSYLQQAKAEEAQKKAQKTAISNAKNGQERTGFLGFLDSTLGRIGSAATGLAFGQGFNDTQNQNYKNIAQSKLKQNPSDKAALANLQMQNTVNRAAKNGVEKASDFIGGTAGVIAPYTIGGAYGLADAALGKIGLNAIKNPIAKDLVRGIGAGTIAASERLGTHRVASNEKVSPSDAVKQIGTEAAFAGGGDAALGALGRGIMKLLGKGASKAANASTQEVLGLPAPKQEVLGLPAPQLKLNAPQLQLEAPKIQPSLDTLLNVGKKPGGLQNPIPSMPEKLKNIILKNDLKNSWSDFAQSSKTMPKARPQYITNLDLPADPFNRGPEYWQQRYNDFVKFAHDNGYNENNLNHDAINELWTHFAKNDEPVNINQVVDLAYPKGYEAPSKPVETAPLAPIQSNEPNLKDLLAGDPKINDAIKKLFPNGSAAPKISRPATLEEMVQNLESQVPPKQAPAPLEPLQFRLKTDMERQIKPKQVGNMLPPLNGNKNSNLLLSPSSLKPENVLKTVSTNKTLDRMSKEELQTVYKELQDKKASLTTSKKKASKKQMAAVEEDLKKVNDLLMKSDLQMFGKAAEKKSIVKPNNVKGTSKQPNIKQQKAIEASKQKKLVEGYKKKKNDLKAEIAGMLKNSDNWKDKPMPSYKRETMTRNFEDVMGKDAETFKKKFIDPIGQKEAESVRFRNEARAEIGKYKINGNTNDSALAQKYGEGLISLDELKQQSKNWKNVGKLSEHLKQWYKEVLPKANEVLKANGYDPIPMRENYFPHAQDLTKFQEFAKKHLGIDFTDHTLPTDINGLTENYKPGKQFFGNFLRRTGDKTNYDAIANFDKYVEGISNVLHHTENIKRLRAFEDVLRTKYTDSKHLSNFTNELKTFTNMFAGKKVGLDHKVEEYSGRRLYTFVDNMRKRTGANTLAYNVSSSLTNTIPALTQAPALMGKKYFAQGMLDTISNVVRKDGFETDFLTRREGSDPLYRDFWGKVTDKGFWLMKTVDKFASQSIVRGKYYELIDKGLSETEAKQQADTFASKIMADRSKGQMPTLFADRTLSLLTQFQLEVNNQMSFMFKDIPRMSANKKAMASAYAQVFLYGYLFNSLFEKTTGRRPAFDPIGVVTQAVKDYNNDNISKGQATWNTIGNVANQLPFSSMFTGGRYPIEAGIPNIANAIQGKSPWTTELTKPLTYLIPPVGGGQAKKVLQTANDFGLNPLSPRAIPGSYKTDSKGNQVMQYPIANNPLRAGQEALFGRSALPETRDYFDNQRRQLTPSQTKSVENSSNPMEQFKNLSQQRRIQTIQNEMKKVGVDKSLTPEQKQKKYVDLLYQLQKVQGGK
jgi:hypothetical protein